MERRTTILIISFGVVFVLIAASFIIRNAMTPPYQKIRESYPYVVVLDSNEKLEPGDGMVSPNKEYRLKLDGNLILERTSSKQVLWTSRDEDDEGGAVKCSMQSDGNIVLRRKDGSPTWRTNTHKNSGAQLILDNGGQIAVISSTDKVAVWLAGLPRGNYDRRSKRTSLEFPIRGIFYYPWFPETWTVESQHVFYKVSDGYYSSGDGFIQRKHVETLHHIRTDIAIASWFGPNSHLDRARITNMMVETSKFYENKKNSDSVVKWTVYHEEEFRSNPSINEIRQDLEYLKKWFVWRDTWAYIDDRPVIFVYNEGNCDVTRRWVKANSNKEWYIVLKVFGNDEDCPYQPDGWHQYGPSTGVQRHRGLSYVIAPGFWRADENEPASPRFSKEEWYSMVQNMVKSNEPFQLIISFNEWGEGTAIESAEEWSSSSGHGYYIDALHDHPTNRQKQPNSDNDDDKKPLISSGGEIITLTNIGQANNTVEDNNSRRDQKREYNNNSRRD